VAVRLPVMVIQVASLDGMQKIVGDSAIGVAGDNIFEMVKRRYQKKIEKSTFLPKK